MISAAVLLFILECLKRRLLQNEPPGELYEDIAAIESRPTITSWYRRVKATFLVQEDSSGSGKH